MYSSQGLVRQIATGIFQKCLRFIPLFKNETTIPTMYSQSQIEAVVYPATAQMLLPVTTILGSMYLILALFLLLYSLKLYLARK